MATAHVWAGTVWYGSRRMNDLPTARSTLQGGPVCPVVTALPLMPANRVRRGPAKQWSMPASATRAAVVPPGYVTAAGTEGYDNEKRRGFELYEAALQQVVNPPDPAVFVPMEPRRRAAAAAE